MVSKNKERAWHPQQTVDATDPPQTWMLDGGRLGLSPVSCMKEAGELGISPQSWLLEAGWLCFSFLPVPVASFFLVHLAAGGPEGIWI